MPSKKSQHSPTNTRISPEAELSREFSDLCELAINSVGLAPIIALFDIDQVRDYMIDLVELRLKKNGIAPKRIAYSLTDDSQSLLAGLKRTEKQQSLPDTSKQALIVSISSMDESALISWFADINIHREAIAKKHPYPIIFWLTEGMYKRFAAAAPDFLDWHIGYVNFTQTSNSPSQQKSANLKQQSETEDHSLIKLEKRLNLLQTLLQDALDADDHGQPYSRRHQADLHGQLGQIWLQLGQSDRARDSFNEQAIIATALDDLTNQSLAEGNFGYLAIYDDELWQASDHFTKQLELAKKANDTIIINRARQDLDNLQSRNVTAINVDTASSESSPNGREIPTGNGEIRNEHGIIVLIDLVEFTPQSREHGADETARFGSYFVKEISKRCHPYHLALLKRIGDAVLLFGRTGIASPEDLINFMLDVFVNNKIPGKYGFRIKLRMVAHEGHISVTYDDHGNPHDIDGAEAIVLFRVEKEAKTNQLLVTDPLFQGLNPVLHNKNVEHVEFTMCTPLKGLEARGLPHLHLLMPPIKADDSDPEKVINNTYAQKREILAQSVRTIPIFGKLYPPIRMQDNFLDLKLDLERERRSPGDLLHYRDFYKHRTEVKSICESDDKGMLMNEPTPKSRLSDSKNLPARKLFNYFNKGCIAGLPGAGKTTILRYFSWKALQDNADALILFINCRDLKVDYFDAAATLLNSSSNPVDSALITLVYSFLIPDTDKNDETPREKAILETFARFRRAWEKQQVIIIVDALDECPTDDIKQRIISIAQQLMSQIQNSDIASSEEKRQPDNRFFITARHAELEGLNLIGELLFHVNAIDQDQMRDMARYIYGEHTEIYQQFNDLIWQNDIVKKTAGTPLTAMLLLFYFEANQEFELRYATYDLILKFVLDQIWAKVKDNRFINRYRCMSDFFKAAKHPDFLKENTKVENLYDALSETCFYCLHDADDNTVDRVIQHETLMFHLQDWQRNHLSAPGSAIDIQNNAAKWIEICKNESLLVAAGRNRWLFIHSTIMEFLAGRYIVAALNDKKSDNPIVDNALGDRNTDDLESFPIACGHSYPIGYRLIERAHDYFPDTRIKSTLPFRCLVEIESIERRIIDCLGTNYAKKAKEVDIKKESHTARWIYQSLINVLMTTDSTRIDKETNRYQSLNSLCRQTVLTHFLPKNWDDTNADLTTARKAFLEGIVDKSIMDKFLQIKEDATSAKTHTSNVSTLDCSGDPEDKNFGYYKNYIGSTLTGFCGSPNLRHSGPVNTVSLSPCGTYIVSASFDNTLKLWDVKSGKEIRTFKGHQSSVRAGAFAPDGRTIVSASDDNTLKLWDVKSGKEIRTFKRHQSSVRAGAFAPDGRTIVSASSDNTLKLWDVKSGKEIRTFKGHQSSVRAGAFAPNGSAVVSASDDQTLKLWDVK